jgi:hypothetical protein
MSHLTNYQNWKAVFETAIAFDPKGEYSDPSLGLTPGGVDSGRVFPGGKDGHWGGAMPRALAFARVANDFMRERFGRKNSITSQKRSQRKTASGGVSDHYEGNPEAYAVDIACNRSQGDQLFDYLMQWFGHPELRSGKWINVIKDGYRYQIGWRVPQHFNHIHVGVKRVGSVPDTVAYSKNRSTQVGASTVVSIPQGVQGAVPILVFYPGIRVGGKMGRDYLPNLIQAAVPEWYSKYVIVVPNEHSTPWQNIVADVDAVLSKSGLRPKNLSIGIFSGSGNGSTDIQRVIASLQLESFIIMDPSVSSRLIDNVKTLSSKGTKIYMMTNPVGWKRGKSLDELSEIITASGGKSVETGSGHMSIPTEMLKAFRSEIERLL